MWIENTASLLTIVRRNLKLKGLFRVVSFLIIISDRIAFPSALIWHPNKWNEIFDFLIISSSYHVFNEYEQNLFRKNFWIILYGIQSWALKNDCLIYTTKQTVSKHVSVGLFFILLPYLEFCSHHISQFQRKTTLKFSQAHKKLSSWKIQKKIYATLF